MALQKRGIPVELVRYPRSNHDLSRPASPGSWWTAWAGSGSGSLLAQRRSRRVEDGRPGTGEGAAVAAPLTSSRSNSP